MVERYLLGVDIGTSGTTGVLTDPDLNVINSVSVSHSVSIPNPAWAEHEADDIWWSDFIQISQQLLKQSDISTEQIAGIGVSAISPTMLPLDKTGTPLRPAILYGADTRSGEEIELLNDRIGKNEIYDTCGHSLTFQSAGPKILWYKRNEPQKFERTEKISDATGYIVYKLTGEYTIGNGSAAFFDPLFNPSALEWENEMLTELGLERDQLPTPQWSTEIAGKVSNTAAEATGLKEGTPVIVGTVDTLAAQISVGAVEPGDLVFVYGTAGVVFATLGKERRIPGLWSTPHSLKGKYGIGGGMATSSAIIEWFRDEFGGDAIVSEGVGKASYSHLNNKAADIQPGSEGLVILPYFSGERTPINDDSARGTIIGLNLSHTRYHIYRAILEAVGYGFRHNLAMMEKADVPLDQVFCIGGGARSDLWRQIVSDITGVSQQYVSNPVGAPLGDAYLAGLGTNVFEGLGKLKEATTVATTTKPDLTKKTTYDEYYSIYRDIYPSIKDNMHQLAALSNK
jgi:xylulokinase